MKYFFKIVFVIGIISYLLSSCLEDQGPLYINPCPCDTTPYKDCECDEDTLLFISYSQNIQPLWDEYCIECHDGNIEPINLITGNSFDFVIQYINLEIPEASDLYQLVYMNFMPPEEDYRLNDDELDLVLEWIKQGAKNN